MNPKEEEIKQPIKKNQDTDYLIQIIFSKLHTIYLKMPISKKLTK